MCVLVFGFILVIIIISTAGKVNPVGKGDTDESLGGNLIHGGSHSFKKEVREPNAWYQNELKEYQAVEAAAMKFVKSVAEGNRTYAKELFTDEAVLFGYLDGKLEHGSIEQFYHNVDTVPGGDNFKARVDVLLVEESLTVVRVLEEGWGNRIDFTDV